MTRTKRAEAATKRREPSDETRARRAWQRAWKTAFYKCHRHAMTKLHIELSTVPRGNAVKRREMRERLKGQFWLLWWRYDPVKEWEATPEGRAVWALLRGES
jgi:hypothetical protein